MLFMRLALALVLALSAPLYAQKRAQQKPRTQSQQQYVYTYWFPDGRMVINNLPPDSMKDRGYSRYNVKVASVGLAISPSQMSRVLRSPELLALVDKISSDHSVDTWLVRAIIQAESAFYERAHSHKGAMGLMQLIPATARRFGVIDPFDPVQNITGGVKYLRWLIDHFNGDYTKVIAAYNAGEGAVKKYNGIPPFAETRAYVPKVRRLWENKSVIADPKAKGAMEFLNAGHGGFQIGMGTGTRNAEDDAETKMQEAIVTPTPRPLRSWINADGTITISDMDPPKDAKNVKDLTK